jgi:hypothetical protein
MRRLCLLTALTLLAVAPGAAAKEVTGMKICGREGCAPLKHSVAQSFHDDGSIYGRPLAHDPGPVRGFRLMMFFGDGAGETVGRVSLAYAPALRAVLSTDAVPATPWQRVSPAAARHLDRAAGALTPFAAKRLRSADAGVTKPKVWKPWKEAAAADADDGGVPTPLLAGVPAVALLLGLGLLVLRRR